MIRQLGSELGIYKHLSFPIVCVEFISDNFSNQKIVDEKQVFRGCLCMCEWHGSLYTRSYVENNVQERPTNCRQQSSIIGRAPICIYRLIRHVTLQ